MKSFNFIASLSDSRYKAYLCGMFISASLICCAYFIGSAFLSKDYKHTHQGPYDPPSQPGFPGPPGAVPPPPGSGYYMNEGYPPGPPPPPPPQSYQDYYNQGGGGGGGGDYNNFNYGPPQHIGHQRYGYDQDAAPCSSLFRACLATLCCCFICQECCLI